MAFAKQSTQVIAPVDLTTVEPTELNKSYIIDKKLLDHLLSRVTKGNLEDIKEDLRIEIAHADDKKDLFDRMENYIYLNTIVEKFEIANQIEANEASIYLKAVAEPYTKAVAQHSDEYRSKQSY